MQHLVIIPFVDEVSGEYLLPGTSFICDDYTRVQKVHNLGFIRKNPYSEGLKKPSPTKKVRKNVKQD